MMNATHGPGGALKGVAELKAALALKTVPGIGVVAEQFAIRIAERPTLAILWVLASAAGALLPDSDHPSSTTARMWGWLTRVPCAAIGQLAGGHREATHDVSKGAPLFFALAAAVGWVAGGLVPPLTARLAAWIDATYQGPWAAAAEAGALILGVAADLLTVAVILGLAFVATAAWLPGRWEHRPAANFAASWGGAYALDQAHLVDGATALLLAGALAGGVLVGGIGLDALTPRGVPWRGRDRHLLPERLRIPTGRRAEACLRVLLLVGTPALAAWAYGVTPAQVQLWLDDPPLPADVAAVWDAVRADTWRP